MIEEDCRITMIEKIKNQAIKPILKIKVQTMFKELGYPIDL
jgi:hypothetical protein